MNVSNRPPEQGQVCEHLKSKQKYVVIAVSNLDAVDQERYVPTVTYFNPKDDTGKIWSKPLSEFNQSFHHTLDKVAPELRVNLLALLSVEGTDELRLAVAANKLFQQAAEKYVAHALGDAGDWHKSSSVHYYTGIDRKNPLSIGVHYNDLWMQMSSDEHAWWIARAVRTIRAEMVDAMFHEHHDAPVPACQHPPYLQRIEYKANTGNYDSSSDRHWKEHHCYQCHERWSTDQ